MLGQRFAFGPFLLNPDNGTLLCRGEPVAVGRRGVLLLEALLKRSGEVVTKAELLDAAWPDLAVEESNLSVQIALLRKALGATSDGGEWIVTIPRIGYRFLDSSHDANAPIEQLAPRPSLAVLPFANLSSDVEQEFFADGLADEILTTLSKVPTLLVIARSSSFAYKGVPTDVRRVAKDLGVRYILEGSVRKDRDRIRIVAQLSDGMTGSQLWAERYDQDFSDLFAIQDEVARKIVAALSAVINPIEAPQWPEISVTGTASKEAYECFLRGRAIQRGATQNADVFQRTSELFRQAISHDPGYPPPYAALGMALAHGCFNRWVANPADSIAEAQRLADKAIELDPTEPFAHSVAALVAMYQQDFDRWAAEVEAALSLNPNFGPAVSLRGTLHMYSGSPQAAINDLRRAMRLDPLFTQGYLHHLGVAHIVAGDYETAVALLKERILLVPETDMSRAYLAAALGNLGYVEEARRVWDELMAINPDYSVAERIGLMPFKNRSDLARIERGLSRAGVLNPSVPRAYVP